MYPPRGTGTGRYCFTRVHRRCTKHWPGPKMMGLLREAKDDAANACALLRRLVSAAMRCRKEKSEPRHS